MLDLFETILWSDEEGRKEGRREGRKEGREEEILEDMLKSNVIIFEGKEGRK